MKKESAGIFRTIPIQFVHMERELAIQHGKSLDGVATAIYARFFDLSAHSRDKIVKQIPAKRMGRKIKQ